MTKDLKNKFKLWLDTCLTFEDFRKRYEKMVSTMTPECAEKFNNLEEMDTTVNTEKGPVHHWLMIHGQDDYEPEISLFVITNARKYYFRLTNRELGDMGARLTSPNPTRLDFDGVSVLEIEDLATKKKSLNEVIIMRTRDAHKLIYRELVGEGRQYQQRNTQNKTLSDEQVDALLGEQAFKKI